MPRPLFLAGLGRSGTTALTELFDSHPKVAIGMERYKVLVGLEMKGTLTPDHFTRERFFDFSDGLTNIRPDVHPRWHDLYEALDRKWDHAEYVGDKLTHLRIRPILESLPDARFLCIIRDVRDVAASWDRRARNEADPAWAATEGARAALLPWNRALRRVGRMRRSHPQRVAVVEYERLFGDPDGAAAAAALQWLGLEPDPLFDAAFAQAHRRYTQSIAGRERTLSDEDTAYLEQGADLELWGRLRQRSL
ncbi:sulfotransferase [Nocardioides sp. cx-173]|uniref:sulfotransferase family protein n=1 Tax=Nocardioides sp. cx-173 TaxID=2898796 RepID=UPI001E5A4D8B|nr:sulfotransferase [Nocardioides sp. cx-173]MCD4524761.1 sulfotransferase [Nocardioides sp. cx-173]UGB43269.1 sulfotransferase [Nocardioides sp. cx-173]